MNDLEGLGSEEAHTGCVFCFSYLFLKIYAEN